MQLLFASGGRIGRATCVAGVAVVVALFAAYERFVHGLAHLLTGWAVHLVLLFMGASVLAKRLHDRGRSGWWAAVIVAGFDLAWPQPHGVLGWLGAVVLVGAAVDLALMPGERGFNAFGARP